MVKLISWAILFITIISIAIYSLFQPAENNQAENLLQRYFNYGRSIESKLFRQVSDSNENAADIAKAGWFQAKNKELTISRNQQHRAIYIYGMSFSNNIGEILAQEKALSIQVFSGPGAPLNHSYAYYKRHQPNKENDIVILGILASSLAKLTTVTHMTSNFEAPAAHFYPRYILNDTGFLTAVNPPVDTLEGLRSSMYQQKKWHKITQHLRKYDAYFSPVLFHQNLTDNIVYLNLIKRALSQKYSRDILNNYHDKKGFKNTDNLIEISQKIISDFAVQVRQDNATPFIILFNDRGYSDHLYQILAPTLKQKQIAHYSTHKEFPADNLSYFIADGHFKPEIERIIAKRVLTKINQM